MTPHRHWLRSYRPHRVPVRLADSTIVYSAGIGSVLFVARAGGEEGPPVRVLSNVLHVPDLRSNLLSVPVFDSQQAVFSVILETVMSFIVLVLFCSQRESMHRIVHISKASTSVSTPIVDSALSSSTLPMDASLWQLGALPSSLSRH